MRVIWLATILLCVMSTAMGQEGSVYHGEITVFLKNGQEVTTDYLFVKRDQVKVAQGWKGEQVATEDIDHIAVLDPKQGDLHLEPAMMQLGYNGQQGFSWLIKRWETLRIAYYERQVYRQTNTAGRGRGTKAITYYYRKDGGGLLMANTSNVEQTVEDHPVAYAMLEETTRRHHSGMMLQMASLAGAVGLVATSAKVDMEKPYSQLGGMAAVVSAFGLGINLSAGIDQHLEGALHLYQ